MDRDLRPAPNSGASTATGRAWMLVVGSLLTAAGWALDPVPQGQGDGTNNGGTTIITNQTSSPPVIGNSDSNNRMIAVTGVDITGSAVLYVIDSLNPHIAVYQANGGSPGTQSIKLVAARRIDLDLQLDGLNDRSEFTYQELAERFSALPTK
ncbi:MAG: hypothetical protein H6828_11375 [Planctomycetes bacterium]|nr:hypothetical protein [Planctomycetota bacterium]